MSIDAVKDALLWSAVINYGVLLWWLLVFTVGHGWMYRMHSRWFSISTEQFDAIHYAGMAVYKIGILLLTLVPYLALLVVT
jgi:hypothetical protein